jgi:hypothetical protein
MAGGLQEWWNSQGATALGPKWLAMFLASCGHGMSFGALHSVFSHSGETISRKIEEVFFCVVAMCEDYIRPIDPNFRNTHRRITNDRMMMPHFKDCIGALDGSHILATPPLQDLVRYIGRSGKATQNVLAIVDFDLRFTYASIGQPGFMYDTNVLFHALRHDHDVPAPPLQVPFYIHGLAHKYLHESIVHIPHVVLHVILGKYYTVDV